MISENNKRIAKNTFLLYIRMFVSMIVGLYTSRVVLNILGVEDYGIYGLVGGCVSMFSFLNASMSGATSRFLTFEMGRDATERLRVTFSSALLVHIIIALVVAILAETVGMWFLLHKLVIPEGRMFAAKVVLHCSVISMFFTVLQVPYNAAIMSHEKMDMYAYIEMLNVFLKLAIVYLLVVARFDRLILYAILQLCVTGVIMLVYVVYDILKFPETHPKLGWNKDIVKPMLSYSGWDLFGMASTTFRSQGTNFLINMFFGVVYNAAASVALIVQGVLLGLCHNILAAFRPQIIKQYSSGNSVGSIQLIYQASKFTSLLMALLAIPFITEMDIVMKLWLGTVPQCAPLFCRIMLVASVFNMIECCVNVGINAYGKMGPMSFYTGLAHFAVLPVTWIMYKLGAPVYSVYILAVFVTLFNTGIKALLLRSYITQFSILQLIGKIYCPLLIVSAFTAIPVALLSICFTESFLRLVTVCGVSVIAGLANTYYFGLDETQRTMVMGIFKNKLNMIYVMMHKRK